MTDPRTVFRLTCLLLLVASCFDARLPLGPLVAHPSGLLILLATPLALLSRLSRRDGPHLQLPDLIGIVLFGWVVLDGAASFGGNTLRRVVGLGLVTCSYFITRVGLRTPDHLRQLSRVMLTSAALAGVAATITRSSDYGYRAYGAFGNPNSLGMFIAGCMPLAMATFLRPAPSRTRVLRGLAVLTGTYGLWISGSRGALIGMTAGLVYVLSRNLRRAALSAGIGALLVLGVTAIEESSHGLARIPAALEVAPVVFEASKFWLGRNGFADVGFTDAPWVDPDVLRDFPQTLGARMIIWYQACLAAWHNPLLGIGPGNSYFTAIPFDSKTFRACFNIYLAFLVETGLGGFLLHLWWLSALVRYATRAYRRSWGNPYLDGLVGSCLAVALHGMIEDTYFGIYTNWLVGILFAAVVSASEFRPATGQEPAPEDPSRPRLRPGDDGIPSGRP